MQENIIIRTENKRFTNFREIEDDFYLAIFCECTTKENIQKLWNRIKKSSTILKWAIQKKRYNWANGDSLNGPAISYGILSDSKNIDKSIYQELILSIYTNLDIARIRLNVRSDKDGYSFLQMSLWNHDLLLTEEQKTFAVFEAKTTNTQPHFGDSFDIRYQILKNPN